MPIGKRAKEITPFEHAALFSIINKVRMLNGWAPKTAQELDSTIRIWYEALLYYEIPSNCYDRLYFRAIDTRQTFLMNGKEPPLFNAELLISSWTGANGLQAELREEEIRKCKTLTENASSQCPYCYGTGHRYKFDENGNRLGIMGKCNHQS